MTSLPTHHEPHRRQPTRLVVVGGVAAGMSCAARARRLDETAEIVVLERGEHVSFAGCGLPYHVGGEIEDRSSLLVQTPRSLSDSLRLDVRTRHEVVGLDAASHTVTVDTPSGMRTMGYDALVLAPGAAAVMPSVPGIDSPRVHTLRTVPDADAVRRLAEAATRAVVVGGGFIGVETAEALAARGVHTTIVQRGDHVLTPLDTETAWHVTCELRRLGVDVRTRVSVAGMHAGRNADTVVLTDGTRIEAGLIVVSAGVRPDTAVFERAGVDCLDGAMITDRHGRTSLTDVWAVGDATAARDAVTGAVHPVTLAGPANRAGRLVADAIFRPDQARPIPDPVGTAVVRVGRLTAALTGANRAQLRAAHIAYRSIHLHPTQHTGFFPGAQPVHLLVHMDATTGRLLGAQAVGGDGVDKRIDVLATAVRAGLAAPDLIDLDLAYAPPYGQAKDPVNLAGMVAENTLNGSLSLWYAQDLDAVRRDALVLDVRRDDEVAEGMLPGALHVPHIHVRANVDRIRRAAAGRPVRVMCASGVRSALVHRILAAEGFDSASLSGGMQTLRAVLGDRAGEVLTRPDAVGGIGADPDEEAA